MLIPLELQQTSLLSGSNDQSRDEEVRRHVHAKDDSEPVNPGCSVRTEPIHQDRRDSQNTGHNHGGELQYRGSIVIQREEYRRDPLTPYLLDVQADGLHRYVWQGTN